MRKYKVHFFLELLASIRRIEKKRARDAIQRDRESREYQKREYEKRLYQKSMFENDIEVAANKMADSIIGEQVARWIK